MAAVSRSGNLSCYWKHITEDFYGAILRKFFQSPAKKRRIPAMPAAATPMRLGGRRLKCYGMTTPKPLIDKAESRRIRVQIRRVLLEVWDPIGVKNEPYAQDEYDGYIGGIYEMLTRRGPDSELIDYLYWAAHEHMGLDATKKSDMITTVDALRRILIPQNSE